MKNVEVILDVFVERIDDFMKQKGWNIKKLSEELNIPRRTLNSWILKNRVPRIDYIYMIADYLNVSIDYLVGREQ